MLDKQTGQSSIRSLSWDRFEELISELYRRQGFQVSHSGGNGPDGGIDQRIRKAGEYALVQCKHWRSEKVGVKVARELLGVVTSEKADYGVLITSGTFTDDAIAFARKNPLELINGEKLMALLEPVQEGSPPKTAEESTPICPACGCLMLRKTARRGPNPGTMFWGCPNYTNDPSCTETRDIN